jgi:hypothetical protein
MMQPSHWAANKANAQLSTGPTIEAGKQTVSQNALRHGLSGRIHAALPGEQDAFAEHCVAWREALLPVGTVEEALTQAESPRRTKRPPVGRNSEKGAEVRFGS